LASIFVKWGPTATLDLMLRFLSRSCNIAGLLLQERNGKEVSLCCDPALGHLCWSIIIYQVVTWQLAFSQAVAFAGYTMKSEAHTL